MKDKTTQEIVDQMTPYEYMDALFTNRVLGTYIRENIKVNQYHNYYRIIVNDFTCVDITYQLLPVPFMWQQVYNILKTNNIKYK